MPQVNEIIPLWHHQRQAVSRAAELMHFALFFEVGTGKTSTTINILRHKYQKHRKLLKTLIVAPLITLENWKREIAAHSKIPQEKVVILKGTKAQREASFLVATEVHNDECIFLLNYEALAVMPTLCEILCEWKPEVLVFDESHKIKDYKSKRTKMAIKLADRAKYKYILTGTPFLNNEMDIFSQFRVLDGGETFSKKFFIFRDTYFYDKNARMPKDRHFPDWQVKPGAHEKLHSLIYKKAMRVTKEQCLDLPEFVEQTVFVDLTAEQKKNYEEMRDDYLTFIEGKAVVASLALTKGLRLLQIASGYLPIAKDSVVKFQNTPRMGALKEMLADLTPNHKVIVWAVFKENYEQIRKVCEDLKIKYVECHGEISGNQKSLNVDYFTKHDNCRVFIGHPGSAGIGINITCSDVNISYSRNFSLADYIQAQSRSHRAGQTQKVTWINIVAKDTIEEGVLKSLANKQEISDKILTTLIKESSGPFRIKG